MNDTARDDDWSDQILRTRIAAVDPAPRATDEPIRRELLEHIMNTAITPDESTPDTTTTPTTTSTTALTTTTSTADRQRRRSRWFAGAATGVAAAAAAVVGFALLDGSDADPVTADPLVLTGGSDTLASCMPFTVDILADMPTAFEGTAIAVDGPTVTLSIDRWYQDGTASGADTVVLNAPAGMEALIDGIAFEPGGQYLVTADAAGNVNYCGYTAPATDELRASFDQAFPAG